MVCLQMVLWGGNINYVPKRAKQGENQNSVKLTYGDGKQFGQQLDYGVRTNDVGRILRTFKIKKNVEVTDNGKIII